MMPRRKYRRNYQMGGFGFLKKIMNKFDGGLYDKYGRERKWNEKSGRGQSLYQPLTYEQNLKYYNKAKKNTKGKLWNNVYKNWKPKKQKGGRSRNTVYYYY